MAQTPDQIVQKMLATLNATMPTLSCALGTPERKILEAVAEAISEAYVGNYYNGSLFDVDTKSGLELEQFVGIFGFGRLQGSAARGTVTITVQASAVHDQSFALGTLFYTTPGLSGLANQLYYSSTSAVVLTAGSLTTNIPVRCTTVGSNGNVPPDSITYITSQIGGSTCTNLSAMIGGTDTETDQELRQRFKDTLLRNVAGTSDFYEALCQQNTNVSRVVVFGPLSLYQTQITVPSTELVLPVNQDVKYAWPQMESVFAGLGSESETFFSPLDDYTYAGGTTPSITTLSSGALEPLIGTVVNLEFQYTTRSSRNNPLIGITNKVDCFVDGVNPVAITEQTVVSASTLNTTSTDPLYTGNFQRIGSPGSPASGNRFMRLGSTPIVNFPSTITVGGTVYTQGTHYFLLQGTTLLRGSQQEISGIEWTSAGPATNTELALNYVYNNVPEVLNALISSGKQLTTDVMVHQGDFIYLQPCVNIEYDPNYSVSTVNSAIVTRLQSFFSQFQFGQQVKLASLMMFIMQTNGVVDVTLTTSTENSSNYGVQVYHSSINVTPDAREVTDFKLNDNQLAFYQGVVITQVATP
jgi:uncharacterized phage protein gp47/JayE